MSRLIPTYIEQGLRIEVLERAVIASEQDYERMKSAAQAAYRTMVAMELSDGSKREWDAAVAGLRVALAESTIQESLTVAEQEPVGKFSKFSDGVWKEVTTSSPGQFLYTAPPRREWVGLTGDEIEDLPKDKTWWEIIRAAEEILREKNT